MSVKPYNSSTGADGKKLQVEEMFNTIAPTYDLLNRLLSFRCDVIWRNIMAKNVAAINPNIILDVATGTGDVALTLAHKTNANIVAVDIAQSMLDIGIKKRNTSGLNERISFSIGDAENMPLSNDIFDAVTVAFGVRNFENLQKGLAEMRRVIKPNAPAFILEFSMPDKFPARPLYLFYFRYILPIIGRLVAKDRKAYTYLFKSVEAFPKGQAFVSEMEKAGFRKVKQYPLTLGVVCLYIGVK